MKEFGGYDYDFAFLFRAFSDENQSWLKLAEENEIGTDESEEGESDDDMVTITL